MRLLIDLQAAQGISRSRGIGRYSRELALAMARAPAGHELVVLLHDSLASVPAFLRFGQLVVLERHETELTARAKFLEIRANSLRVLADLFARSTGTDAASAAEFAAVALALVDGAFLARAAGEHGLDDSAILGRALAAFVERRCAS